MTTTMERPNGPKSKNPDSLLDFFNNPKAPWNVSQGERTVETVRDLESKIGKLVRKFKTSLRRQFMKWLIYNVATFALLSVFYVPYQIFWLQLSTVQFLKWLATSAFFGSIVNIIVRPYVGVITRFLDRRYGSHK